MFPNSKCESQNTNKADPSKWQSINILQFLNIYEKYPCLWNPRMHLYNDNHAREAALVAITVALNVPGLTTGDIRKQIKFVRTNYKRELESAVEAQRNGSIEYLPKLYWFSRADIFLRSVTVIKPPKETPPFRPTRALFSASASDEDSFSISCEEHQDSVVLPQKRSLAKHEFSSPAPDSGVLSQLFSTDEYPNETITEEVIPAEGNASVFHDAGHRHYEQLEKEFGGCSTSSSKPTLEKKKTTCTVSVADVDSKNSKKMKVHTDIEGAANPEPDELANFCQSITSQIRAISDSYSRSVAKVKIQQIIFEAETGKYRSTDNE